MRKLLSLIEDNTVDQFIKAECMWILTNFSCEYHVCDILINNLGIIHCLAQQLEFFLRREYGISAQSEHPPVKTGVMSNCFLEQLLWLLVNIGYQNTQSKVMFL